MKKDVDGNPKDLFNLIISLIKDPHHKKILEIGSHDDELSFKLSKKFKHVYSFYEYLKIKPKKENNLTIAKKPFPNILKNLDDFDVILVVDEFHHFSDIYQMMLYEKLNKNQELLIIECNFKGNFNNYYKCFQNCIPLSQLTKEIMNQFKQKRIIQIENQIKGKYEFNFTTRKGLIDFFKFILPDHWRFGKNDFYKKIIDIKYPFYLWEEFNIFKIKKL